MRISLPALLALFLLTAAAQAQPAFRVKDINTTTTGGTEVWPFSAEFADVAGTVYFSVADGIHGSELWKTDGTAAGTVLVADICPGICSSSPRGLTAVGPQVFFTADDGSHGPELWKSDGTAAGTVLVADLMPGLQGGNPASLMELGGALLFTARDHGHGWELWRSDGTTAGTVLVKDINPAGNEGSFPTLWTRVGGTVYLSAEEADHGRELWKTDGTAAGTVLVADIFPGPGSSVDTQVPFPGINNLAVLGGTLFFRAADASNGSELWRSDGTAAGTALVKDINPGTSGSFPNLLVEKDGVLFFAASTADEGTELWTSDGTPAGTSLVKDIIPGLGSSNPQDLGLVAGRLLFRATDDTAGRELWTSDGTAAGTTLVKDIQPGLGGSGLFLPLGAFAVADGRYFFFADDGAHGFEPWVSDGTPAGTILLRDIESGLRGSFFFVAFPFGADRRLVTGGRWYFRAFTAAGGVEVWTSDGTPAGTQLLKEINTQTSSFEVFSSLGELIGPRPLADLGGTLVFQANGPEGDLWKSDGTEAGTQALADIYPGPLTPLPREMTALGDRLLFRAQDDLQGEEPWITDGTPAGTGLLKDISPVAGSSIGSPSWLTRAGDRVFFSGDDGSGSVLRLWVSDGTETGTTQVFSSNADNPEALTPLGSQVIYRATAAGEGVELWASDGTEAGALLDVISGDTSPDPNGLVAAGGSVFFSAWTDATGRELWKTDGTPEGTVLVKDIRPGTDSSMAWVYDLRDLGNETFTAAGGTFFFTADDGTTGQELWKSDGTEAGTVLLKDILPGIESSEIRHLTAVGSRVYFVANDGVHGRELWVSDGTPAGTRLLLDILPGPLSSLPQQLAGFGHVLLFSATDGIDGREPWRTNGTLPGTFRLQDIAPGPLSSSPLFFTAAGARIYFAATDTATGFELWGGPRRHVLSTFRDTRDHFAWQFIEALALSGLTSGCGGGDFCPERPVNRAEAAVFLVRGSHGLDFVPPPATGTRFQDVGSTSFAAAFIEQLAADGLTNGCSTAPPLYCPQSSLTRAEMAVFLLLAMNGPGFVPPPATGTVFTDVPAGHFAAAWIEELARAGITAGCGGGQFCPERPVTRGELAVFLTRAFNLPVP